MWMILGGAAYFFSPLHTGTIDATVERKLLEKTIGQFGQVSGSHLAKLKTRLNMLVAINRLPAELLVHIIILTYTPKEVPMNIIHPYAHMEDLTSKKHPYVPYTWNPSVWVLIQHGPGPYRMVKDLAPFDREIFQRSKSAKVDIIFRSSRDLSMFEDVFTRETNRVRRLMLFENEELIRLVLSGKCFPSLQALVVTSVTSSRIDIFDQLLPLLVASDQLETLECVLGEVTSMKHLAQVLGRIRNLTITISNSAVFQFALGLLHNNTKLYGLRLKLCRYAGVEIKLPHQVVWPELRFLSVDNFSIMEYVSAPKLRTLHALWKSTSESLYYPILEEFDFPSIRFLYIKNSRSYSFDTIDHIVLGSKERIPLESVSSSEMARGMEILFEDITSPVFSRDYFYFRYHPSTMTNSSFAPALQATASVIFSRLTSLMEVYLLYHYSQAGFQEVVTHIPSVEKLVIQRGDKLLDFIRLLSNTAVSSAEASIFHYLRQDKDSINELKYIALRNCPPLPDTWLEKIRELGTEVATESDISNVIIKTRKTDREQRQFSDVET
ncbi:hypothetical protein Clacol_006885 [Clathrus columnatus]|uniref:Uncharacterized protein n=1 Tax=Clathrus columnatus TaxID=1419009 RepID=A0AAV5AG61_9AGAM|nr:hypothetical protein Clacol_006885 [Clathrus columnatus]